MASTGKQPKPPIKADSARGTHLGTAARVSMLNDSQEGRSPLSLWTAARLPLGLNRITQAEVSEKVCRLRRKRRGERRPVLASPLSRL